MNTSQWIVTIMGLVLIIGTAWLFWGRNKGGSKAITLSSGFQEARIKVKSGYTPDTIVVQAGKPVRLVFIREETSSCSEIVVFPDFQKSASLPYGKNTTVELLPQRTGIFSFTCQMGMYKGKMVVKD